MDICHMENILSRHKAIFKPNNVCAQRQTLSCTHYLCHTSGSQTMYRDHAHVISLKKGGHMTHFHNEP